MNNDIHMYRVWDKLDKRYVCHLLLGVDGLLCEIIDGKAVSVDQDRYEREQCTGERDRNGKLIYEGDILKGEEDIAIEAIFRFGAFGYEYFGFHRLSPIANVFEVVGNIHEVKHE